MVKELLQCWEEALLQGVAGPQGQDALAHVFVGVAGGLSHFQQLLSGTREIATNHAFFNGAGGQADVAEHLGGAIVHLARDPVTLVQGGQRLATFLQLLPRLLQPLPHQFEGGAQSTYLVLANDSDGLLEVARSDALGGQRKPSQGPREGAPHEKGRPESEPQGNAARDDEFPLKVISGGKSLIFILADGYSPGRGGERGEGHHVLAAVSLPFRLVTAVAGPDSLLLLLEELGEVITVGGHLEGGVFGGRVTAGHHRSELIDHLSVASFAQVNRAEQTLKESGGWPEGGA